MASTSFKDRNLIAVIGDEVCRFRNECVSRLICQDSITGLLLAGIGHINEQQKKNFLVVNASEYIYASVLTLTFHDPPIKRPRSQP